MKYDVSRPHLIELLAAGQSLTEMARTLGYHDRQAMGRALRYRGIRRTWTRDAVPVIEVRG